MNDFTDNFGDADLDNVETFVEHDLAAPFKIFEINIRMHCDAHFSAVSQYVDCLIIVLADDDAVSTWWLGQLLDFIAQRSYVLP